MESVKRAIHNNAGVSNSRALTARCFVYIHCPNCNRRLIQTRDTAKKPRVYLVDEKHPAEAADLTIKCERCKSIVAIDK